MLLVACAVHWSGGRGSASRRVGPGGRGGPAGLGGRGVTARRRGRAATRGGDPTTALAVAVTAVAAELRAGKPPGDAWRTVLGVPVPDGGVPTAPDVVAVVSGAVAGSGRGRTTRRPGDVVLVRRVHTVLAATRLAVEVGAPLAPVLDGCARSLAADADAETALRAALAGPRQTTTLLTALPLLGVALGTLLGADPLGVLLGGGPGSVAGVVGLTLTFAGRAWVARMVAAARSEGEGVSAGGGARRWRPDGGARGGRAEVRGAGGAAAGLSGGDRARGAGPALGRDRAWGDDSVAGRDRAWGSGPAAGRDRAREDGAAVGGDRDGGDPCG